MFLPYIIAVIARYLSVLWVHGKILLLFARCEQRLGEVMTATELLLIGVITMIAAYGGLILDRLQKPKSHKNFTFEVCDYYVAIRIETIIEDDFQVAFIDDWEAGRSFSLYGAVMPSEGERAGAPEFGARAGVKVGPTANWFEQSRLGGIRFYAKGGGTCYVALPYQIARHVLEDVRRNPNQIVQIGFKKTTGKNGTPAFPIYSFELCEPLD